MNQTDIDEYFTGPAFLPWNRMGNLNGFGGGLSQNWHKMSVELQHKILKRMRGLGMTPVLPAFAGHVPNGLLKVRPSIRFMKQSWQHFNETLLLDPTDSLFVEIGSKFLEEYEKEFGPSDHIYNCDTFNEMTPVSKDHGFLAQTAKAVYSGMATYDAKAVWLMQGWLFIDKPFFWSYENIRAYLTAIPKGNMVILDLDSTNHEMYTKTESYFGQPFIFNSLFNFGGNILMYGRLQVINDRVHEARKMANSTMIGIGFTPEGLADNYVNVDLMSEMTWRDEPVEDLEQWISDYATRRYGRYHPVATRAWKEALHTVFNATDVGFPIGGTFLITMPKFNKTDDVTWYKLEDLFDAWRHLLSAADDLKDNSAYRYVKNARFLIIY